jgi:hypothetical protein
MVEIKRDPVTGAAEVADFQTTKATEPGRREGVDIIDFQTREGEPKGMGITRDGKLDAFSAWSLRPAEKGGDFEKQRNRRDIASTLVNDGSKGVHEIGTGNTPARALEEAEEELERKAA